MCCRLCRSEQCKGVLAGNGRAVKVKVARPYRYLYTREKNEERAWSTHLTTPWIPQSLAAFLTKEAQTAWKNSPVLQNRWNRSHSSRVRQPILSKRRRVAVSSGRSKITIKRRSAIFPSRYLAPSSTLVEFELTWVFISIVHSVVDGVVARSAGDAKFSSSDQAATPQSSYPRTRRARELFSSIHTPQASIANASKIPQDFARCVKLLCAVVAWLWVGEVLV